MTRDEVTVAVRARATDEAVYAFAEERDGNVAVARATLEAEAFSDVTGLPLDYHTDWQERLPAR